MEGNSCSDTETKPLPTTKSSFTIRILLSAVTCPSFLSNCYPDTIIYLPQHHPNRAGYLCHRIHRIHRMTKLEETSKIILKLKFSFEMKIFFASKLGVSLLVCRLKISRLRFPFSQQCNTKIKLISSILNRRLEEKR